MLWLMQVKKHKNAFIPEHLQSVDEGMWQKLSYFGYF